MESVHTVLHGDTQAGISLLMGLLFLGSLVLCSILLYYRKLVGGLRQNITPHELQPNFDSRLPLPWHVDCTAASCVTAITDWARYIARIDCYTCTRFLRNLQRASFYRGTLRLDAKRGRRRCCEFFVKHFASACGCKGSDVNFWNGTAILQMGSSSAVMAS